MATQPLSEAGVVYSPNAYIFLGGSRSVNVGAGYQVAGSLVASGPLRPVSAAGVQASLASFARVGAERVVAPVLTGYVTNSIVSLLNLRLFSRVVEGYTPLGIVRTNSARPIAPGYLLFIPAPPPPPVDASAPIVGNFTPTPGTAISRTGPVSFDVTDDSGDFRRIFIVAFFPTTGMTELVYDGDGFRGFYVASSARIMIAAGFRYTVLRSGGWPAAPTIQTFAIDRAGNEAN